MKIAICCSTRFRPLIQEAITTLEAMGHKPVFPDGENVSRELPENELITHLAHEHHRAINESDLVYFIVPDGYAGTSLKIELGYAVGKDKLIYFSERTNDPALDHYPLGFIPINELARLCSLIKVV